MRVLQSFERVERGEVSAMEAVEAVLEASELSAGLEPGVAEGGGGVEGRFAHLRMPGLGFDFFHAAAQPFGTDESVYQRALFGCGGEMAVVVFGGEHVEFVGALPEFENGGFGVDAGFEGVDGGAGAAERGAGAGGALRVAAAGFALELCWHVCGSPS